MVVLANPGKLAYRGWQNAIAVLHEEFYFGSLGGSFVNLGVKLELQLRIILRVLRDHGEHVGHDLVQAVLVCHHLAEEV